MDHCAVNLALYAQRGGVWCMTERGRDQASAGASSLSIGPSAVQWDGRRLTARIDERGAPWPRRVRGSVIVTPQALNDIEFDLDEAGRHRWRPIAPHARVEVRFDEPGVSWSGDGYLDTNGGEEPLEAAFESWTWSRAHTDAEAVIHYDVRPLAGGELNLALAFDGAGPRPGPAPDRVEVGRTGWALGRQVRADAPPTSVRTLEDTPFYARTLMQSRFAGKAWTQVHETLSFTRLRSPVVKLMLPFRMPRLAGRRPR